MKKLAHLPRVCSTVLGLALAVTSQAQSCYDHHVKPGEARPTQIDALPEKDGSKSGQGQAQPAATKVEQPPSASGVSPTVVSQHPLIAQAVAAAKARTESSKKCRRFFNYQGVEAIDQTSYFAQDLGTGTVAAARVGQNVAVNINPRGAFMHPPAEFVGLHAAEDIRGFFILHELGHQLSQATKFVWDHSELKSLNDLRHDLNDGRLRRNCY
jgi:hypothetical protein